MPPTSPAVAVVLDDVFTLCRLPFVHDFLFTPDPVADIAILTAPVQNEHAIAARITVTGTENSASYAHIFDFSADTFFCSVPALSVGSVVLGFATQERASEVKHAALNTRTSAGHVSCSRYVRDDQRGVFLMLSENAATGMTELDCMSHRSARRRTRVLALFRSDALRRSLRSPRGVLHPDDLVQALSFLSVAHERRACPVCRRADAGECGCTLPFQRPAHALDFRNERRNMSLHTGLYQGESTVRLFNEALPIVITDLTTRSVINGSLDAKVIARLTRYAVQDRMCKLKANPFSPALSSVLHRGGDCGKAVGLSVGLSMGVEEAEAEAEATAWDDGSGNMVAEVVPALAVTPDASFMQDYGMLQTANAAPLPFDEALGVEGAELLGPGPGPGPGLGTGTQAVSGVGVEVVQRGSDWSTSKSCSGKEWSTWSEAETSRAASSGGSAGAASGTAVKAELRKQRNRAAAARSNVKRKVRNETLRRDLAAASRRAAQLRAVEKVLREENVRLRSLANRHKLRVGAHLSHIQISRS